MRWRDGMEVAEAEAWATMGRRNAGFFVYRRLIGPAVLAVLLGGVGYAAYRGWHALASRQEGAGVPALMWFLLVPLLAGTVFAFKGTGRARPFGVLVVVFLATAAAWLVWAGALVAMLS